MASSDQTTSAEAPDCSRRDPDRSLWGPDPSLWDGVTILLRHKWTMSFCFLIVFSAVVAVTLSSEKSYQSESSLLVRLGRENVGLDPTATMGDSRTVNVTQSREQEINSVATLLAHRGLAEEVVDQVGAEWILDVPKPAAPAIVAVPMSATSEPTLVNEWVREISPSSKLTPRDRAVRTLQQGLEVEAVADTSLVSIRYESHDPELSRAVVSKLVDLYLAKHVQLHRPRGTHEFLSNQMQQVEAELRAAEERLRKTKSETGLVAPTEQREALVKQIATLRTQSVDVKAQMAEVDSAVRQLREKLQGLSKTLVTEETSGAANYASDGMRGQLYALQLQHQQLLSTHTKDHPEVKQIELQIEAAEAILAKENEDRTEVTTGVNRVYEETELELIRKEPILQSLRARSEVLENYLAEAESELKTLNDDEITIARLQREVEIQESKYRKYATDTEQARIDSSLQAAQISNISLAQPATLELYPASPNLKLNLLLGFIMAVFSSVGLALISESHQRWKTSHQV